MISRALRKRILSLALASAMAVTSVGTMPVVQTVYAEKGETIPTAKRSFDSSYDSQNAYSGTDLGCTYTKEKTTFKVWSPLATKVVLCRYATGSDGESGSKSLGEVEMAKGDKGVWSVTVDGDIVNTYYTYKVTANDTTNEAVDIYAKAVGVNGDRAMVVDLENTDPDNWDTNYKREETNLSDIIVWEVHIRDFSIDVSSGVSAENRGKYKAFTETGTTLNGDGRVATCVDYLKKLGVTHVQLLPMYDYASVDETKVTNTLGSNYNWGYDPENYNAPEGSYSSNPYDGNVRIKEMKEMIQALHDAGIKVVMDVVYNHTYDTVDSNFSKIMPDYYYRLESDLKYNNGSGCGNATRSEAAMYNKFMRESVLYWAKEYNLDGFRFDLMGLHDYDTMNQIRSDMDKEFGENTIVLYGEGWTGDGSKPSNSAHKLNESKLNNIGYFNDQIRDAIKGEHKFDGTIGLVQTNYTQGDYLEPGEKWPDNVFGGIMASVGYTPGEHGMWRPFWSKNSNQVLSYTSAHDNLTLWDKLTEKFGKNYSSIDDKLLRMNKMAGAIVLSSHGGCFMQAGEEFARTKNGDENSYKSPDSVNKIDWNRVSTYGAVQSYYEGMIDIRKAFSGFRTIWTKSGDNWNPNNCNLQWISKDVNKMTGFYLSNTEADEWNRLAVLINNGTSDMTQELTGSNNWVIIADGTTAGLSKIKESGSSVTVPGKSVMVAVPKDTFDANPNVGKNNKAPVITIDGSKSYEVAEGGKVEFTVSVSDADGDTVTLTTSTLPEGASFDKATGKFTWNSVKKGTYSIIFTADDGTDKTTVTVKITATAATDALEAAVAELVEAKYNESEFPADVWKKYSEALEHAQAVLNKTGAAEEECAQALADLNEAAAEVKKIKEERTKLENGITVAEEKIKTAKADSTNYEETAIEDLETVVTEAKALLEAKSSYQQLLNGNNNLSEAAEALVNINAKPTIYIKADMWSNPSIHLWTGSGASEKVLTGAWPGTKLAEKNEDGYYVFEVPEGAESYGLVINDGAESGSQTVDLLGFNNTENLYITVTTATETGASNKKLNKADTETQPVGVVNKQADKTKLKALLADAKATLKNSTQYSQESIEVLEKAVETAETVDVDIAATQVEVNKQIRGLRAAIIGLVSNSGVPATPEPTETPDPEKPTETPDPEKPTATPDPEKPTETPDPEKPTATPDPEKPTETPDPEKPTATPDPEKPTETPDPEKPTETPDPEKPTATPDPEKPTATPTVKPTTKPTAKPPVYKDLKIKTIKLNKSTPQYAGTSVKYTVSATGGKGSYTYRFVIKDSKNKVVKKTGWSKKSYINWAASKGGTYRIIAYVQDAKRNIVSSTKKVVYKKVLSVSKLQLKKKKKTMYQVIAKVSNRRGKVRYRFYAKNAKGKIINIKSYSTKSSALWKNISKGRYTVYVVVKDSYTKASMKVRFNRK